MVHFITTKTWPLTYCGKHINDVTAAIGLELMEHCDCPKCLEEFKRSMANGD